MELVQCTTKKRGYPSVFKSAGIAPKSAGIGSKFLSRRFFSRRFRPPLFECGDRVVRAYTSALDRRFLVSKLFWSIFRFQGYFGHFKGFRGILVIFLVLVVFW